MFAREKKTTDKSVKLFLSYLCPTRERASGVESSKEEMATNGIRLKLSKLSRKFSVRFIRLLFSLFERDSLKRYPPVIYVKMCKILLCHYFLCSSQKHTHRDFGWRERQTKRDQCFKFTKRKKIDFHAVFFFFKFSRLSKAFVFMYLLKPALLC